MLAYSAAFANRRDCRSERIWALKNMREAYNCPNLRVKSKNGERSDEISLESAVRSALRQNSSFKRLYLQRADFHLL
jgi:hypothetical protein